MSPTCVLDASAVIAWVKAEPGAETVEPLLAQAALSAVNASEVQEKNLERPHANPSLLRDLAEIGMTLEPFTVEDAELSAALRSVTRPLGLSLADRACLALGQRLKLPVLTADRAWAQLQIGTEIRVIR